MIDKLGNKISPGDLVVFPDTSGMIGIDLVVKINPKTVTITNGSVKRHNQVVVITSVSPGPEGQEIIDRIHLTNPKIDYSTPGSGRSPSRKFTYMVVRGRSICIYSENHNTLREARHGLKTHLSRFGWKSWFYCTDDRSGEKVTYRDKPTTLKWISKLGLMGLVNRPPVEIDQIPRRNQSLMDFIHKTPMNLKLMEKELYFSDRSDIISLSVTTGT